MSETHPDTLYSLGKWSAHAVTHTTHIYLYTHSVYTIHTCLYTHTNAYTNTHYAHAQTHIFIIKEMGFGGRGALF